MITCKNCGKSLADGTKFCDRCGTKVVQEKFCTSCGAKVTEDASFCTHCGANLKETPAPAPIPVAVEPTPVMAESIPVVAEPIPVVAEPVTVAPVEPQPVAAEPIPAPVMAEPIPVAVAENPVVAQPVNVQPEPQSIPVQTSLDPTVLAAANTVNIPQNAQKEKKKKSKKPLAIILGAVALVLVAAIVALIFFTGGKKSNFVLYVKDGSMYWSNLKEDGEFEITESLFDTDSLDGDDVSREKIASYGSVLSHYVFITKDQKTVFYIDKIGEDGGSLCYRTLGDDDAEPVKLDSNVISFTVSDNAKVVTYMKTNGEERSLYRHDLEDKQKIASDIIEYYVSSDGDTVLYRDAEKNVYFKKNGEDKEKVDSEVSGIYHIDLETDTVVYKKDNALYIKTYGKDKEKVDSEVYSVKSVFDGNKIYYIKEKQETVTYSSFVEDDVKETDENMVYPTYPQTPYSWNYDSYEEYEKAYEKYEKDSDAYYDKLDEYRAKQERDRIREQLDEETEITVYALYYFDGSEKKLLCDSYTFSGNGSASEKPVLFYGSSDLNSVNKVKMSELTDGDDIAEEIADAISTPSKYFIAVEGEAKELKLENIYSATVSYDGKTVAVVAGKDKDTEDDDHNVYEIYKIEVSSKAGDPEKVAEDAYPYVKILSNGDFEYFKDMKKGSGDMYIGDKRVDYDVSIYDSPYETDDGKIVYYTDYNVDKRIGTLKIYDGGEAERIADDVYDFFVTGDGKVLYLTDYSTAYYRGELKVYDGKESEKLDDDVTCIIHYR